MRRPRPDIGLLFRRLTTTDDRSESKWFPFPFDRYRGWTFTSSLDWFVRDSDTQNGYRKSGSRLIDIGCPTQVCGGFFFKSGFR